MRTAEFRWSQVRVSLFLAIAGIILFAAIFYLGLIGSPLSRTATIYGYFDDVSGLAVGSSVEMSGVVIGQISNMELPNVSTGKVPVALSIDRGALSRLGKSSMAFAASHALVGQRYVGVTVRTLRDTPLKDGDVVQTRPGRGFEQVGNQAADVFDTVKPLIAQAEKLVATLSRTAEAIDQGQGTMGRLVRDDSLYEDLDGAAANAKDATGRIAQGRGALGALIRDRKMAADLRSSADALALTAERVRQGKGVLGKLTNDDEQAARVDRLLANVDAVSTRLAEAQGTLGALISDPTMLSRVNALLGQMDSLVADVHRNPQRYLKVQAF